MGHRTTISWSEEDSILLLDLSKHKGKAIGSRIKRLAMTGLMMERLGITMDSDGAIRGLADRFAAESRRGVVDHSPLPPSGNAGVMTMFEDKAHEEDYDSLLANMGL